MTLIENETSLIIRNEQAANDKSLYSFRKGMDSGVSIPSPFANILGVSFLPFKNVTEDFCSEPLEKSKTEEKLIQLNLSDCSCEYLSDVSSSESNTIINVANVVDKYLEDKENVKDLKIRRKSKPMLKKSILKVSKSFKKIRKRFGNSSDNHDSSQFKHNDTTEATVCTDTQESTTDSTTRIYFNKIKTVQEKRPLIEYIKNETSVKGSHAVEVATRMESISNSIDYTLHKLEDLLLKFEKEEEKLCGCEKELDSYREKIKDFPCNNIESDSYHFTGSTLSSVSIATNSDSFVGINQPNIDLSKNPFFIRTDGLKLPTSLSSLFSLESDELGIILSALVDRGLSLVSDEQERYWKPNEDNTRNIARLKRKEVLVWSRNVDYECHGKEFPIVKSKGIIDASPQDLVDLLIDSSRVKTYNKWSLGRSDIHYFQQGIISNGKYGPGECKIIRNTSEIPLLKTPIELTSLLYVRELNDYEGKGFIIVTRAVHETNSPSPKHETLLGLNLITPHEGNKNQSELTVLSHGYGKGIPMIVLKKLAFNSAVKFVKDIQLLYDGLDSK